VVVGILATALAARVSDPAAAALALSNQLAAMLVVLLRVIGAGISVVVAQCLGSGRRDQADAVARACLGASSWMGLACAAVALAGAWPAMGAMQAPADVAALAAPLLQWLAPALLLDAWNASMASVMRAHLRAREVLAVILVMHLSHLLGAVLLMPVLGLPGFALAMGLSRLIGLVLHVWLWRARLQLRPQPSDWWRLPRAELAAVLHIGLPGAAENIAWRMGFTATVAVAGSLGAQALATQAYVQQLASFAVLFTMACGLAMEILIGHLVGAGDFRRADRKVRQTLLMSISLALCINVAIALAGTRLLGLFTQDATIIRQGQQLLWLTVVLEIGRCFNVVLVNALRAAGDARFPVVAGVASMALVLGAGSGLLAHTAGLGLAGIWIAYAADEWLRGLIMWWRWRRLAWLPHARGVVRRMRQGRSEGRAAQD
jgi:putative MATE family efflux protein